MPFAEAPSDARIVRFHRNLPHWCQSGAVYFVTFRLADSLPSGVLARLRELKADPVHISEFGWVDRYLDAGTGSSALGQPAVARGMADVLLFFDGTRYQLGDFVIMPNHVHVILRLLGGVALRDILHSWKSYSAKKVPGLGKPGATVWQKESFDRLVRDEAEYLEFQSYILANPAAAGLPIGRFLLGRGSL